MNYFIKEKNFNIELEINLILYAYLKQLIILLFDRDISSMIINTAMLKIAEQQNVITLTTI